MEDPPPDNTPEEDLERLYYSLTGEEFSPHVLEAVLKGWRGGQCSDQAASDGVEANGFKTDGVKATDPTSSIRGGDDITEPVLSCDEGVEVATQPALCSQHGEEEVITEPLTSSDSQSPREAITEPLTSSDSQCGTTLQCGMAEVTSDLNSPGGTPGSRIAPGRNSGDLSSNGSLRQDGSRGRDEVAVDALFGQVLFLQGQLNERNAENARLKQQLHDQKHLMQQVLKWSADQILFTSRVMYFLSRFPSYN